MSIEREAMAAAAEEDIIDDLGSEFINEPAGTTGPSFRASDLLPDMSFVLAPTGEGLVEDYIDHAMNPRGSHGVARILRGATGMLGQLNYAIIDIALGTMEVMKEGKQANVKASNGEQ